KAGGPAMGEVAGRGGLSRLPAQTGIANPGERLAAQIDAGGGSERLGVTFGRIDIRGLARPPRAARPRRHLDEADSDAFAGLALPAEKHPPGFKQPRRIDSAGLIKAQ